MRRSELPSVCALVSDFLKLTLVRAPGAPTACHVRGSLGDLPAINRSMICWPPTNGKRPDILILVAERSVSHMGCHGGAFTGQHHRTFQQLLRFLVRQQMQQQPYVQDRSTPPSRWVADPHFRYVSGRNIRTCSSWRSPFSEKIGDRLCRYRRPTRVVLISRLSVIVRRFRPNMIAFCGSFISEMDIEVWPLQTLFYR